MKTFFYNRTKDYESKSCAVIAEGQKEALDLIVKETNTNRGDWFLISERDCTVKGVVCFMVDSLGV